MTVLKSAVLEEDPCGCDISEGLARKDAEQRAAEEEIVHLNGHLAKQCIPIGERAGVAADARCVATLEARPTRLRPTFASESTQSYCSEDEGCFSSSESQGSGSVSSGTFDTDRLVKDHSHSSDSSSTCGDLDASVRTDVQAAWDRHYPRQQRNGYPVVRVHAEEPPIGAGGVTADLKAEAHGPMLELMICPGDLLFFEDTLQSAPAPCASVCVVMTSPMLLPRHHRDAQRFVSTLRPGDRTDVWLICVLEWSAEEQQLHSARKVFYVEHSSRRLVLAGDADHGGAVKHVLMELQQSPVWLRARMRVDLARQAVSDMSSPWLVEAIGNDKALRPFSDAWQCKSSSSSVGIVVTFWQLYLVALAKSTRGEDSPGSLLMKWMPLAADKAEIGDLRSSLQATGWVAVFQIPVLEPPFIGFVHQHRPLLHQQTRSGVAEKVVLTTLRAEKVATSGCDSMRPGRQERFQTPRNGVSSPKSSERRPNSRTAPPKGAQQAGLATPMQPLQPVAHDVPSEDDANLAHLTRWLFSKEGKKSCSTTWKSI